MPNVQVVLGSKSDLKVVQSSGLTDIFRETNVYFEVSVCSAHRNPQELGDFVFERIATGAAVFIGVAGMAAALPGSMAGLSEMQRPVIGVPLDEHGIDSCLYMPPGVPVLTAGVGKAGLKNAAVAACQILAAGDDDMAIRLGEYIDNTNKEPEYDIDLEEVVT